MTSRYETGFYEPIAGDATHLLDGGESVTRVRIDHQATHEIRRHDRGRLERGQRPFIYPQIDRAKMEEHGLYLVHTIPRDQFGFCGSLLVTGDRLKPIPR